MLRHICEVNEKELEGGFNSGQCFSVTYDFGYIIGRTTCVPCPLSSKNVYFRQRGTRKYLSRMVRHTLPLDTSNMTVIFRRAGKSLIILTAWIGSSSEPELGNINAFEVMEQEDAEKAIAKSAKFWLTHALIDEAPSVEELYKDVLSIASIQFGTDKVELSQFNDILKIRLDDDSLEIPEDQYTDEVCIINWLKDNIDSQGDALSENKIFLS